MKKIPTRSSMSLVMLAALGAVTVPAVYWVLTRASEVESIAKILEKLK